MTLIKTLSVGLTAFAVASSAMAQTFFDQATTIQGKNIDLGNAGRIYKWSALSTDGNISAVGGATTSPANIDIEGNVGVWGNSANLILSNSRIQGDLYIRKGATPSLSGTGGWSGSKLQSTSYDTILGMAKAHAMTLSTNVSSLTQSTNFSSNFSLSGGSINLAGGGQFSLTATNSSPVVLKLSDFQINGGSVLTLNGTSATKFVINVNGNFGLGGGSKLELGPNVDAKNVLFNVTNALSSGTVGLSGGSQFNGLLFASNRAVGLSGGSQVFGQITGKSIALTGQSKAKKPKPPKPSP